MTSPSSQKAFKAAATVSKPKSKRGRSPSYTLRLSLEERAQLDRDAGKLPLSVYIRQKLLNDSVSKRKVRRSQKVRQPRTDHVLLGKLLGTLGQSQLASSLKGIAEAAQTGNLALSADLESQVTAACADIQRMRHDLITALGVKAETGE